MVALYVGAGLDVHRALDAVTQPILCVDRQPSTGCRLFLKEESFLKQLDQELNWFPPAVQGRVRRYGPQLTYLANTAVPEDLERVAQHGPFTTLLVLGPHHPHERVLELLSFNVHFVGGYGTRYVPQHNGRRRTVVQALHEDEQVRVRFDRFTYLHRDGFRTISPRWEDFLRVARSA